MKVLVVTQIAANERDLEIMMVGRIEGSLSMVSPIITLVGMAKLRYGNPYSLYGREVEKFAGCSRWDCEITVAECMSGSLN